MRISSSPPDLTRGLLAPPPNLAFSLAQEGGGWMGGWMNGLDRRTNG